MKYYNKFFHTMKEARAFQHQQGFGALYTNTPKSKTKSSYASEAMMLGLDPNEKFCKDRPYVVAWND